MPYGDIVFEKLRGRHRYHFRQGAYQVEPLRYESEAALVRLYESIFGESQSLHQVVVGGVLVGVKGVWSVVQPLFYSCDDRHKSLALSRAQEHKPMVESPVRGCIHPVLLSSFWPGVTLPAFFC